MRIKIKVIPNSRRNEVLDAGEKQLIVRVKEKAEKGKANLAVINLLKKHFRRKVRIVSGFSGKMKVIEVGG